MQRGCPCQGHCCRAGCPDRAGHGWPCRCAHARQQWQNPVCIKLHRRNAGIRVFLGLLCLGLPFLGALAQAVDVGVLVLGQRLVGVGQSLCRCTLGVLGRVVVSLGDKASLISAAILLSISSLYPSPRMGFSQSSIGDLLRLCCLCRYRPALHRRGSSFLRVGFRAQSDIPAADPSADAGADRAADAARGTCQLCGCGCETIRLFS